MAKPRNNGIACLASALGGLALAAPLDSPGAEETEVAHFLDSSRDRTPSLTAFPRYPSIARRDRIEGEATVCFNIRANGQISRAVITNYTHKIFAKPALRAMRNSTFEPLLPGQVLKTARTCRTYRFRLEPLVADNTEPE